MSYYFFFNKGVYLNLSEDGERRVELGILFRHKGMKYYMLHVTMQMILKNHAKEISRRRAHII